MSLEIAAQSDPLTTFRLCQANAHRVQITDDQKTTRIDAGQHAIANPRSASPLPAPSITQRCEQRRGILLIEDGKLLRNMLAGAFRDFGFLVWTAADGADGVECYRQFNRAIDVVLSDVHMPVLDGPKTLEALLKIDPALRLCFMTGDLSTSTSVSLLRRGALRVFQKPFESVADVAQELWQLATGKMGESMPNTLSHDEQAARRTRP